jgi:hypothetical protein
MLRCCEDALRCQGVDLLANRKKGRGQTAKDVVSIQKNRGRGPATRRATSETKDNVAPAPVTNGKPKSNMRTGSSCRLQWLPRKRHSLGMQAELPGQQSHAVLGPIAPVVLFAFSLVCHPAPKGGVVLASSILWPARSMFSIVPLASHLVQL